MTATAMAVSPTNYPILDGILAISLVVHSHIGFDQILADYVHVRKFPIIGPTANWTLRAATCVVLIGVYQFNTEDIGQSVLPLLSLLYVFVASRARADQRQYHCI
jgi:succinate dehydrogenase (ubiquinone) membrane anchor subunit